MQERIAIIEGFIWNSLQKLIINWGILHMQSDNNAYVNCI